MASCAALIIQSLAANLGVVTGKQFLRLFYFDVIDLPGLRHYEKDNLLSNSGKHLAEHCRTEYPRVPNFILWVLAEISIVACDIPEGNPALQPLICMCFQICT